MSDIININSVEIESVTKFIPRMNKSIFENGNNAIAHVHLVHQDCKRQFTRKKPKFALLQCRIEKIDFEGIEFKPPVVRSEFKDCKFDRCRFVGVPTRFMFFKNTACERGTFDWCELFYSRFEGACFERTRFENCEIDGAVFKDVAFDKVCFACCKIKNTRFLDLPSANIVFATCTFDNCVFEVSEEVRSEITFDDRCQGVPELF